jgi:hypothetical protein
MVSEASTNETTHWFRKEFSETGERLIDWARMRPHTAMNDTLDGLIIGGGRAQSIPKTHNHAGFPIGIVGAELVVNMARQARNFGTRIECGTVTALRREADGF